jgi:hypothetical protein
MTKITKTKGNISFGSIVLGQAIYSAVVGILFWGIILLLLNKIPELKKLPRDTFKFWIWNIGFIYLILSHIMHTKIWGLNHLIIETKTYWWNINLEKKRLYQFRYYFSLWTILNLLCFLFWYIKETLWWWGYPMYQRSPLAIIILITQMFTFILTAYHLEKMNYKRVRKELRIKLMKKCNKMLNAISHLEFTSTNPRFSSKYEKLSWNIRNQKCEIRAFEE